MYNNVFFLFVFFCRFCVATLSFFCFFVARFDGLRPLLVTCHCSLCSLANKLRSFVRSFVPWAIMWRCLRDPTFSRFDTIPACDR